MSESQWHTGAGRRQPRQHLKGRQSSEQARDEVKALLRGADRDLLIENLHNIQDRYGCLRADHLCALAELMKLSQAEVYEVATFYAHFDVVGDGEAPPPLTVRVCASLSCALAGNMELYQKLRATLDTSQVRVLWAPCMGQCAQAPAVALGHNSLGSATVESVQQAVQERRTTPVLEPYEDFEAYRTQGGYETLQGLRQGQRSREAVDEVLLEAGLKGLGGAGFPTGRKWALVRGEPGPRYLVVNGDEGEPGTFKDREVLERSPHVFLEGMLIAAWSVEAVRAYVYIRDEYPGGLEILRTELAKLEGVGLVEPGFVELRRGAGAYICGEESAMIESLEGKRGLPRHRPPYVASQGLFGRPTLVNNVETLYWVTRILREGAELMAVEHNGRRGLRSYSVSGRVQRPGVYVLPAGSTIRDILEASGGMLAEHTFKAYQPGGPSSGLLPASLDDIPLDFGTLQEHGSFIGSAAVVILSDRDSVREAALNMLRFFEDESCGQCTPCRMGCAKAVQLMEAERWDGALLEELCDAMADASICGLGQAAPNPVRLVLKHFPEEVS